MIHDLLTLEAYFATFKGQFGIEDFVYGTADDILNRKNMVIRYPCLWLELLGESDDDNDKSFFDIRITLQDISGKSPREKDRIMLNTLRKNLKKVLEKMRDDSPNILVFPSTKAKFEYKDRFANDDELLAMAEVKIGAINVCDE